MGPRHKLVFTSISPPLYEKKHATKLYTEGTNQQYQNMNKKFSEMAKVRSKLGNILSFWKKYQLHHIYQLHQNLLYKECCFSVHLLLSRLIFSPLSWESWECFEGTWHTLSETVNEGVWKSTSQQSKYSEHLTSHYVWDSAIVVWAHTSPQDSMRGSAVVVWSSHIPLIWSVNFCTHSVKATVESPRAVWKNCNLSLVLRELKLC